MADTRPFVVEGLDAQQERRNPGLPVVYVGQSLDPVKRLELLRCGRARPKHLHRRELRLLDDLVDTEATKKRVRSRLLDQGFTIYGWNSSVWQTYVIALDDKGVNPAKRKKAGSRYRGWVYVGESSRTPEERCCQHLEGAIKKDSNVKLYNKAANKWGLGLHQKLMATESTIEYSSAASKAAEKALARKLEKMGYVVEGGH